MNAGNKFGVLLAKFAGLRMALPIAVHEREARRRTALRLALPSEPYPHSSCRGEIGFDVADA